MKLTNNTILITGGTSGIGLALADRLADMDNTVIVLGRSESRLADIKTNHPNLVGHQTDVSKQADVEVLASWVTTTYPDLNVVINSAGIMRAYNLFDKTLTIDSLTAEVQTNLIGTIAVDKSLLNHLVGQPESLIVNVSSGLANLSSAAQPIYSATKAGVHMFTDALREQLRYADHQNIHVMELVPPLVAETNLESSVSSDVSGNMKLSDLVDAAIRGMERDKIRVNAGLSKVFRKVGQIAPDFAEHQMATTTIKAAFPDGLK